MQYPRIDKELIGKKIVSIYSSDNKIYTVVSVGEHEVEAHRSNGGSTWAFFGISGVRPATQAEIANDGRFEGSCPHKFRSYLEKIKEQRIPYEFQLYKQDYSKPSGMSINAYICDWCGQHIDRDTDTVLKPPVR